MFTPEDIIHYRGTTALHCPNHYSWVYLIHFSEKLAHAGHYLGSTVALNFRLRAHASGNGARLMEVISEKHIGWELVRLWRCDTPEDARRLEKKLKSFHGHSPALCPICQHKPLDPLVGLRQGKWPLRIHAHIGRRQPMPVYRNQPFERREAR